MIDASFINCTVHVKRDLNSVCTQLGLHWVLHKRLLEGIFYHFNQKNGMAQYVLYHAHPS